MIYPDFLGSPDSRLGSLGDSSRQGRVDCRNVLKVNVRRKVIVLQSHILSHLRMAKRDR